MAKKHIRYDDDVGLGEPSDSEDDYSDSEKIMLDKFRNRGKQDSDSEVEVYGLGAEDDDDDEDESDLAMSDVEGQEDDDNIPNARAWGKDKRNFYSTDYVDADYGGFQGKDGHLAELEEEEARNLQKQLAQQLDDDDFSLEMFAKTNEDDVKHTEEIIKTDISKLTKRQKLHILQKESPEFFGLCEDLQGKMALVKDVLHPLLTRYWDKKLEECSGLNFVETFYELNMNYFLNFQMYLILKLSKVNIQNHPVIKRLYQYRQLLSEMEPVYEKIVKSQIQKVLDESVKEDIKVKKVKNTTLKLVSKLNKADSSEKRKKKKSVSFDDEQKSNKKRKLSETEPLEVEEPLNDDDAAANIDESLAENGKRAITYQMAKNKGLTPHRKKEQRNPRVKHRQKFRKALIRRKGAVREPRRELNRYSGEQSGIKASVSKSVKIKY